ncbi:MAG: hypothetical protein JSW50_01795 [Candidatus Latescibacterota bacterium]|nr:MAG: hypothetical protein JSW50_01795 [Candidatus Latescibacterota bacterium]
MKWKTKIVIVACLLFSPLQVLAQNSEVTRATLVGLPGVMVYVDSLAQHLVVRGMTEDVFRVEIERRLLEGGVKLLNPAVDGAVPGNPILYLGITTLFDEGVERCHYAIRLELTQTARLERNPGFAVFNVPTWSVGGIGVYQIEWRKAMIDDVLGFTEEFIEAFFMANPLLKPETSDSTMNTDLKENEVD